MFTITDQHWVDYVLRLEQFLLQRKVTAGELSVSGVLITHSLALCCMECCRIAGVFFDMENTNKHSVRSDARGRRKSLPGYVVPLELCAVIKPIRSFSFNSRQPHIKASQTATTDIPIFRTWATVEKIDHSQVSALLVCSSRRSYQTLTA